MWGLSRQAIKRVSPALQGRFLSTGPAGKSCYWDILQEYARLSANQSSSCYCLLTQAFPTPGEEPTRLLCPWDSPGRNPGMGRHFLLQRIFPAQGSNPGLLHCRQILYHWATKEAQIRAETVKLGRGNSPNIAQAVSLGILQYQPRHWFSVTSLALCHI